MSRRGVAASVIPGVLILGGSYGSLAAARNLGRQGVNVAFLGDIYSIAGTSRYVRHLGIWKGVEEADPLGRVLDFGRQHGLDGWVILPSADFEVQLLAEAREVLGAQFRLLGMDWTTLGALNEKSRLYPLAGTLGLDHPEVYPAGTAPDAMHFPVVIKPSSTQAINALTRAKAWQADNAAQFTSMQAEAARLMGPIGYVVQQRIPGDGASQLSYAGLWDNGREICGMTARRLRQFPIDFGTSPYVESTDEPEVAGQARHLLAAVNYTGLVEVEFKRDARDGRLKLLDVNTRIWAWIGLGQAVGLDFVTLAAELAYGQTMPEGLTASHGSAWRRAVPNLLSALQGLIQRGNPGLSALRSIFGPAQSAVYAADDMRPAIADLLIQARRKLSGRSKRLG